MIFLVDIRIVLKVRPSTQGEEACALIKAAVNLKPSCAKFRHSLGVAYRACGRKEEAVEALEWANEKDPMNVQV